MKIGKYPIKRSDTKAVKSLKRKLNIIEKSILSCSLRGFNASKFINARSWYIEQIKKAI